MCHDSHFGCAERCGHVVFPGPTRSGPGSSAPERTVRLPTYPRVRGRLAGGREGASSPRPPRATITFGSEGVVL